MSIWFYSIVSVFIVSLISLIGVVALSVKVDKLKKILIYLISFSAGALLGDAFIHLLPEVVDKSGGFVLSIGLFVLLGILIFFSLEKIIHWQHCHMPITKEHVHPFAYMSLFGDGIHNFLDGMIIAASYLVNVPAGIATTIAVVLHEIPQEIGDFGILIHGGFSKIKAIMLNFLSALAAVLGAVVTLLLNGSIGNLDLILVPIAAGGFIYIASSDLIPELHKEAGIKKALVQIAFFVLGIGVMLALILLE